jgi:hypothetical protein
MLTRKHVPVYDFSYTNFDGDMRQRTWLRHCAANQEAAGSISDEVIGFFNWPNSSSRTVALGPTQPLIEMSTRNLRGGKRRPARKADNLTVICEPKFGSLDVSQLYETPRPGTGVAFPPPFFFNFLLQTWIGITLPKIFFSNCI